MSVEFAGLQDNPTKALIQSAASAAQKAVGSSPSQIKTAVKTEADAYNKWAKTGNDSGLGTPSFTAADDQINAWTSVHCKQ